MNVRDAIVKPNDKKRQQMTLAEEGEKLHRAVLELKQAIKLAIYSDLTSFRDMRYVPEFVREIVDELRYEFFYPFNEK